MKRKTYEKPTSKSLNSLEIATGSCLSGPGELKIQNTCTVGEIAAAPCGEGGTVLARQQCTDGSSAAYSCLNGSLAG